MRIKWSSGRELMEQLDRAAEKGQEALLDFATELARDHRDHVEEHGRRRVRGFCPTGCGETLYLVASGVIECVRPDCPDPVAATAVLYGEEAVDEEPNDA